MHKDQLRHKVKLVLVWSTTEMKDRTHVLDWDKLSMCDQDDLLQSIFVAKEMPVELESENRFLH